MPPPARARYSLSPMIAPVPTGLEIDPRFPGNASWIEVSAAALRHNVGVFRALLGGDGGARLGAVLKGDAYGHGLAAVLPVVHELVDAIYVITPQDALAIREYELRSGAPARQVLVLGAMTPGEVVALAARQIDVVLADDGWTAAVDALRGAGLGLRARCHVHLDTGLGREGFTAAQLPALCDGLQRSADVLEVVGALSHFANTEDVTEQHYAQQQVDAFETGLRLLQSKLGVASLQRHFAASAAIMVLPSARYDLVRVGISLYGLWPSTETRISARLVLDEVPQLRPVLTWRCRSQVTKWLPAGAYVGYGCTYRCARETRVAVLPVGYYDGYPRLLSSRGHVLVRGERCPVLGRVMMNHIVVDVTRVPGEAEPVTATLLGADGSEQVSAELLAEWAQTINYEIVARLGAHLRRTVL